MSDNLKKAPGEPRLLEHEVDGIREYDNPMPRWWLWIFWITIAWAVLYWLNVPGIGPGKGRLASYEKDVADANSRRAAAEAAAPPVSDAMLVALSRDPGRVEEGRKTFLTSCSPCHRPDAGGNIGPNLTDDYWIHGGRPTDLFNTVTRGVPEKGMPTWGAVFKPSQIQSAVAYVLTLRGSKPASPKAPQGFKVDASGMPLDTTQAAAQAAPPGNKP